MVRDASKPAPRLARRFVIANGRMWSQRTGGGTARAALRLIAPFCWSAVGCAFRRQLALPGLPGLAGGSGAENPSAVDGVPRARTDGPSPPPWRAPSPPRPNRPLSGHGAAPCRDAIPIAASSRGFAQHVLCAPPRRIGTAPESGMAAAAALRTKRSAFSDPRRPPPPEISP